MKRTLEGDLAKLESMAFGRLRHCGPLAKRFHAAKGKIKKLDQAAQSFGAVSKAEALWNVYDWLLAPFTIWPIDFEGLAAYLLEHVETEKPIPRKLCLLLEVLGEPPSERTQTVIADFERDVESGRYEKMVKRREKYEERERALLEDRELCRVWSKIKEEFDTGKFTNKRGVIRRSVSGERNFRQGWEFEPDKAERVFQMVFDAMCYRWQLYGMETGKSPNSKSQIPRKSQNSNAKEGPGAAKQTEDKPLLLKVSFNPTPYGTLIMIPRDISFDPFRDVDWRSIMELHRCWGTSRQGPKMSSARMQRMEEGRRALELWEEARKVGNKGEARYDYVREKMGRDRWCDPGWLRRLLKLARRDRQ